MTCSTCGAALEPDATTCTVCGTAVADRGAEDAPPTGEPHHDAPSGQAWSPPLAGGPAGGGPAGGGQAAWGAPAPAPHPSGLPSDVRNWGLAAHLSAYVGAWVALAFLGPLVVWLIKREDHPFVEHHAKEALNFNISFLLYGVVGGIIAIPIALLTLGIGLIPIALLGFALVIVWLIFPILAAVKAANGEGYRYPLTIRFIS